MSSPNELNRNIKIRYLVLPALLLLLLGVVAGHVLANNDKGGNDRQEFLDSMRILGQVYERVYYNYVEDVDSYELLEAGIQGMMDYLDEHSQYLPPVNYDDLMVSTEGEFGGSASPSTSVITTRRWSRPSRARRRS